MSSNPLKTAYSAGVHPIAIGKSVQKTLAGDDLGFIYDINQDYDDRESVVVACLFSVFYFEVAPRYYSSGLSNTITSNLLRIITDSA